ncbi:MAG: polysaccharide biosynthesis/export family protein [Cyclobacteriaceae bacterium]|nr:polysaccharide biosynthesis/export family protein [Cyclobacteriaceae bacterium]
MRTLFIISLLFMMSCASYKQNIMFKSTDEVGTERINKEVNSVEKNYQIQKNDLLGLDVYSNKGERLIDPNPELSQKNGTVQKEEEDEPVYLVDLKGTVRFPMVGEINLENFTLRQAEEILQNEYAKFFKEPYVQLTYKNKRVILLGALGGHVIPLENENMDLLEVLALGKGLTNESKAQNIRLIRGERVFEIDLSTIQGLRDGNVIMEPGDVIYVEPVRRPVSEALRDYSGALSLLISLTTLLLVLQSY